MHVYLTITLRGRPNAWLPLACLLLWGCAAADQSFDALRANRIRQHTAWMESCSGGPVAFHENADLDIYTADVARGEADTVVSCLLSVAPDADDRRIVARGPGLLAAMVATPFYTLVQMETWQEYPAPAALVRTGGTIHVVQARIAGFGVKSLLHVRDDIFVITSQHITHDRNFLFHGKKGEAPNIRNGTLAVENSEALIFRLFTSKSFWNPGGAFWFDAVVDRHGNILDIVTDDGRICMSPGRLADLGGLDLSRVSSPEVCVWGTPPPTADTAARPVPLP